MNTQLLLQIADRIAKRPEQFQMMEWFKHNRQCGTACCIGGWTIQLCRSCVCSYEVGQEAARLLDLDYDISGHGAANRLFAFTLWPAQFKVWEVEGTPEFAEQAVRRIHHFIQTEGRE